MEINYILLADRNDRLPLTSVVSGMFCSSNNPRFRLSFSPKIAQLTNLGILLQQSLLLADQAIRTH